MGVTGRHAFPWIETLSLLFALAGRAGAADRGTGPPPGTDPRIESNLFGPALRLAASRLVRPGCVNVFGDFRDEAGGTLFEDLDALGLTPVQALQALRFLPSHDPRFCGSDVYAATHPKDEVVYVCEGTFERLRWENPSLAANVLIHELLHTLGLAHDHPSSWWITTQVAFRCGG